MKTNKRKLNKKRIIIFILFIILIIYFYFKLVNNISIFSDISQNMNIFNLSNNYKIIKKDKNKDGYFTTFTTEDNYKKTYIEYKQNGNSSWSNKEYWGGTMAKNGCGITVMSIILSGYGKDYTPEDLREMYYPVMDYEKLSSELSSTFGIKNSDFYYDSEHLSDESIIKHLQTNRPIIICVWNNPTNNRWTTASHYMVLLAADNNNMVYVSNPNGLENDSKSSGWYNIDEIKPYIAKALYIEDYE